ncbi:MAG: hypothetical protein HUU21_31230 [Polyangiaceae bacterium]|nr:hypothetical protein [Polyangiaceae bacterium]
MNFAAHNAWSGPPPAKGASRYGNPRGVTPSVTGPAALKRYPSPAAILAAYRAVMRASSTLKPNK